MRSLLVKSASVCHEKHKTCISHESHEADLSLDCILVQVRQVKVWLFCSWSMCKQLCHEASVSHESFRVQWDRPAVHLNATHKNRNSLKLFFPKLILCTFPLSQFINKNPASHSVFDIYQQLKLMYVAVYSKLCQICQIQQQPWGNLDVKILLLLLPNE